MMIFERYKIKFRFISGVIYSNNYTYRPVLVPWHETSHSVLYFHLDIYWQNVKLPNDTTLCILCQTVKTQMKCHKMQHFSSLKQKLSSEKEIQHYLEPLNIYNRSSEVFVSNKRKATIYAPVMCIHAPLPTYRDSRGIARLICRAITFWLSLQCRGSAGVITLRQLPRWDFLLPQWDFLLCRAGLRRGLLPSACPHWMGLIPWLWKVKSHYPRPSAVDTNA